MERYHAMTRDEMLEEMKALQGSMETGGLCKMLFENSHTVMLLIDQETGAIFGANPAASSFYGYSREKLASLKLYDLNTLPRELLMNKLRETAEVTSIRYSFQHRLANGDLRDVEVYTGPVLYEGRKLLFSIIHDVTDGKRTEEELRQSEERYRQLVEYSPDAILVHSGGAYVYANCEAVRLFGAADPEQLVGRAVLGTVHPDCREIAETRMRQIQDKGTAPLREMKMLRLDGTAVDVEVMGTRIVYRGKPAFQMVMRDITERKRAQRKLARSKAEFAAIFDAIADAAIFANPHRQIVLTNPAFTDVFGYAFEEVKGKTTDFLYADRDDFEKMGRKRYNVNVDADRAVFEICYRRKDGSVFRAESSGLQVRDSHGAIIGFLGIHRDISGRKEMEEALRSAHDELEKKVEERTEQLLRTVNVLQEEIFEREETERALRESEKKYRTLFEESKDVIYIMSAEGKMMDINPAGSELFGYSNKELRALDISSNLYSDPQDRARFLQRLFAKGYVRDFDVQMKKKSGEPLHVLKAASVIRNDRGEIAGYRGIIHDITERKLLERQLLQAQKMESIGLLAGGVAHDFNNLLTAISGYGQIIQEQFASRDELLGTCIDQVMSAVGRAVELTRNLLAFSRKQIINPQPVHLNDIVINLSKLLTRIIGEDIEFGTTLVSRQLTVMADKGQIDQVLINLATNARDAMPQGGRLLIRTDQTKLDKRTARRCDLDKGGAYALISVSDSGQGMDRETLERIFEPFFSTKETGKGTGLGLSIIYGIIKQHSGSITVESEPGKGTTFTIYLPLVEAAPCEAKPREASPPPGGTETLLLAEDDATVRKYMQKILEMAGYTIIPAENGLEAVERYRENRDRIALVLCDVVMPKKNGREVYDEIRAQSPDARFLFTSGYNDEIIHTKGILHENIELLTKPVSRHALMKKLREILEA